MSPDHGSFLLQDRLAEDTGDVLEWVDGHKGLWFWRGVGSLLCVHATDKIWGNQSQSGNGMWLGPSLASCIAWGGGAALTGVKAVSHGARPWVRALVLLPRRLP